MIHQKTWIGIYIPRFLIFPGYTFSWDASSGEKLGLSPTMLQLSGTRKTTGVRLLSPPAKSCIVNGFDCIMEMAETYR